MLIFEDATPTEIRNFSYAVPCQFLGNQGDTSDLELDTDFLYKEKRTLETLDKLTSETQSEYQKYCDFISKNPDIRFFEIDKNIYKHKVDTINQIVRKFEFLPDLIKKDIRYALSKITGLDINHVSHLKERFEITTSHIDYKWGEADLLIFLQFKRITGTFELYKLLKKLEKFDEITLELVGKNQDDLREQAESIAALYRHKHRHLDDDERNLRLECPRHWKRKLRREVYEISEWISNILRLAKRKTPFVSKHTLKLYKQMCAGNKKFLADNYIVNPDGDKVQLSEIVRNKLKSKQSMMYAQLLGMAEKAQELKYTPCFLTFTLPPEYHPVSDKYDDSFGPLEQRIAMQEKWTLVRSLLAKKGVRIFGFHVTEGHKDGTPHRHGLFYIHPADINEAIYCFRYHFPETEENQHRDIEDGVSVNLKYLNDYRGSVIYVNKYLQKTLNLEESDTKTDNQVEEDHLNNFDRHRAWASSRRIRRYGFIGIKSTIGIWSLIYKQKERPAGGLGEVWDSLKNADWKTALEQLGAFSDNVRYTFKVDYITTLNMYNEEYKKPDILICLDTESGTQTKLDFRPVEWRIISKDELDNQTDDGLTVTLSPSYPREETIIEDDPILDAIYEYIGTQNRD